MKKLLAIVICTVSYVGGALSSHYTLPLVLSYGQGFHEANFTGAKIGSVNLSPMPESFYSTQSSTSDNESSSSLLSKVGSATVSVLKMSVSSVQFALDHKKALSAVGVLTGLMVYGYCKKRNWKEAEEKLTESFDKIDNVISDLSIKVKNTHSNVNKAKNALSKRSNVLDREYMHIINKLTELATTLDTIKNNNEVLYEKVGEYGNEVGNLDEAVQAVMQSYEKLIQDIEDINAIADSAVEKIEKTNDVQELIKKNYKNSEKLINQISHQMQRTEEQVEQLQGEKEQSLSFLDRLNTSIENRLKFSRGSEADD